MAGDLDQRVRTLAAELAAAGEEAAAERMRAFTGAAFTTSSEWLGELHCALADARRLVRTRRARAGVDAVALALPGARLGRVLLVGAFQLALVLAILGALGSVTTWAPGVGALTLSVGFPIAALGIVASTWKALPRGARLLAVLPVGTALFALWQVAGRQGWVPY